jgi:hypothetical protein
MRGSDAAHATLLWANQAELRMLGYIREADVVITSPSSTRQPSV